VGPADLNQANKMLATVLVCGRPHRWIRPGENLIRHGPTKCEANSDRPADSQRLALKIIRPASGTYGPSGVDSTAIRSKAPF